MTRLRHLFAALIAAAGLFIAPPIALAGNASHWLKVESPHFVIYSDTSAKLTQAYALKLEQYRYILSRFHGFGSDDDALTPKLKIYFVNNFKELKQIWPEAGEGVAGFYKTCVEDQLAVGLAQDGDNVRKTKDAKGQDENAGQAVLFHEYTHTFMFQHSDGIYPPWYVEGFAEYYSTTKIEGDTAVIGMPFSWRIWVFSQPGMLLPYDQILNDTWRGKKTTASDTDTFYAQSWLLTHYLLSDPDRAGKVDDYMAAYAKGEDPVAAFERIFGISASKLGAVLNGYLDRMMAAEYRVKDMPAPEITTADMPVSANTLLLADAQDRTCPVKADQQPLFDRIRTEAAKYPDDDFAALALARAEVIIGDESQALPFLKTYTAAHPDDAEAAHMLGQTWFLMTVHKHIVDGETADSQMKQARVWLGKGYKLDPLNASNLYYYAMALNWGTDVPSANAVNAAIEAHNLAPSEQDYAFRAADMLVRTNDMTEAKAVLVPLASNPHNPWLAKWVSSIIAAIDSGASKDDVLKILQTPPAQDAPDKS